MTTYRKWDIILVPFPFTDLSNTKKRPALIISPNDYNSEKDFVIVFITSRMIDTEKWGNYIIKEWSKAGLPKPSMIKMKFATIDKMMTIKKLGSLQQIDRKLLSEIITEFFNRE